jgi:crotonyl-CoA reductase
VTIQEISDAIESGASSEELGAIPVPESYRAAHTLRSEQEMFAGLPPEEKDPRRSLHVGEVPTPELAPDEALVAVMASAINYNTVWTSVFEPLSTFLFLDRFAREGRWESRHALDHHVVGSDGAGVVLRTGSAVRGWKPGDRVVIAPVVTHDQEPGAHDDQMLAASQRAWGFETNFGGLADLTVVRASQLLPKPPHLSWEEAAVNLLCAGTSYRMLVGRNAARMKQGDVVLIWGATGGIGGYALQLALNGGAIPVAVVSSPERAEVVRSLGCEHVIDRRAEGYRFWSDEDTQDEKEWRRFGKQIRSMAGRDPDIVFEHPGRETMGASVFVAKRGGTVVTCAATSGYRIEFDNRHLWMKLKRIISSHGANMQENAELNELIARGAIQPALTESFALDAVGEAAHTVQQNRAEGKVGILCLASSGGRGIDDPELRSRIGEERVTSWARLFARAKGSTAAGEAPGLVSGSGAIVDRQPVGAGD